MKHAGVKKCVGSWVKPRIKRNHVRGNVHKVVNYVYFGNIGLKISLIIISWCFSQNVPHGHSAITVYLWFVFKCVRGGLKR